MTWTIAPAGGAFCSAPRIASVSVVAPEKPRFALNGIQTIPKVVRPSDETNALFPVDPNETTWEPGTAAAARFIAAAICALTPGESTVVPDGSWKTGTIELTEGSTR